MRNPKLTPQQKQFVTQAKEYGKKAFALGYTAPYLHQEFMNYLNATAGGNWDNSHVRVAMYKGWHSGYTAALLEGDDNE